VQWASRIPHEKRDSAPSCDLAPCVR
jgi:hypothetical protein